METRVSIYQFSTRPFPKIIQLFDYNSKFKIMKVTQNRVIKWKSKNWVFLTIALKGKHVGVEEIGNGTWSVYYNNIFLGYFDDMNIRSKQTSKRLSQNLV